MPEETRSSLPTDRAGCLIDDLASRDQALQLDAVYELSRLADDRATDPLIRALDDPELTQAAAWALSELKATRAVRPLIRLLEHENVRVQASAARALGQIEDRGALVPLLELASDAQADRAVRRAAAYSLHELGHEAWQERRGWVTPLLVYGVGAVMIAAAVGLSATIGSLAAILFLVGLALVVVYWVRESRGPGGGGHIGTDGGGEGPIPHDLGDLGGGFGIGGGDGGGGGGGS